MPEKKQIKSKQRVAEHGEVFTNEREVNAMLDLVKPETERIESTFLEPACGDGNFLAEIIRRKLAAIAKSKKPNYKKDQPAYEKAMLVAVGSIYGIDIMPDNVKECVARLYEIVVKEYQKRSKATHNPDVEHCVRFILSRHIVCGNALDMKDYKGRFATGYKANLISTLVDWMTRPSDVCGYKGNLISTLVDNCTSPIIKILAIRPI